MSRPPRQDRRLVKVLAALRTHGGPGRSPLYRWMRRHHDTLAAAFAETPPAWEPLASELAGVGLTDAGGKPPAAASARQTWYRVRRDVARARAHPSPEAPALAPDEIAPAVHAVAAPAPEAADGSAMLSRSRVILDIRPARAATGAAGTPDTALTTGAGAADAVAAPDPTPGTPAAEPAAAQLRRLLSTIDAGKVPLPKIM